ncbi:MAG: nuclear transport factor 2 family protein [Chloroflexi bacterium]|nr:nuclear transport factor 2 family protein [Chloroflexota bacterium]
MDAVEATKKLFALIESRETRAAAELLSDDFTFSGPVPDPINGAAWLGLHDRLNDAFSDFSFNLRDAQQVGDAAQVTLQLSGTHSSELDLSALDMPNVPTTGKSFELPPESTTVTFEGEKITSIQVAAVEGGGVMGILSQLGVEAPPQ